MSSSALCPVPGHSIIMGLTVPPIVDDSKRKK